MARTTSLSSIPEDKVPPNPPSFPSLTRKRNSKAQSAQSSSDSRMARATARSKLIEEAKQKATMLRKLRPLFESKVKRFPEKVREQNEDIFNDWEGLFETVDECTQWVPSLRDYLNLRLQNLPGENGMFQVIPKSSSHNSTGMDPFNQLFQIFSMQMKQLLNDLPAPSDFAHPSVWRQAQEATPILCLRPPNARGLPLTTLHHVFRQFQHETFRPLPTTTETVAAQIAASKLCMRMGEAFKNEAERGEVFDECVDDIIEKGEAECKFQPHPASHYGKIDRCIREANIPIVLREDKLEFGLGGHDAYMQIARCYDLVVGVLTSSIEKDPNANNYLAHGAPCFLICLMGTVLFTHPCIC